jgi:chromosome segregation ATPase
MQTVQVVALPSPNPILVDDDSVSVISTEIPNAYPPMPVQMVMTGEDETYLYGMMGMNEYSIEKETGAVYTKNPETGEWLYVTNPMSNIPSTHHNEHMFQTLHAMNFILNQNVVKMNMEIQRLHVHEIQPLRIALDQALGTIKKMGNRKGSNPNPEMMKKIQNLEMINSDLMNTVSKFESDKRIMEESNGKKIVEALAEQLKKFESDMKTKEEEIESYKNRIQSLNRSLDDKEKMNKSHQEEMKNLRQEFESKNQKISEMENEMKTFSTKENEWRSIRSELQGEIRDMKKRIKEYEFSYVKQEDIQHLNDRIRELESENHRIKSNSSKKTDEAIQERMLPLQTENQRLRAQLGNKDSEFKKLKATYDKLVNTHRDLVEQHNLVETSNKREIEELRTDLRDATARQDQLQERFTTVDKAYANAREFCKKISKEKNEMDAGYQNAMRDISKDLERKTFDCEALKDKNEKLETLFQDCMKKFKQSYARNKELEDELRAFQMSVEKS